MNTAIYNELRKNSETFERGFYRSIIPGAVAVAVGLLMVLLLMFFLMVYYVNPIYRMLGGLNNYRSFGSKYSYTFDGDDQLSELNDGITELTGENIQLRKRIKAMRDSLERWNIARRAGNESEVISRNVGFALLASAFFMFLSILVSIGNGNDSALAALLISFTLTFTVGIFPFIFVRKPLTISLKDGYMIIFLSWMLSFIFGMLPYVLWGGPFRSSMLFRDSFRLYHDRGTILTDVEVLPDSLLFWRSSTHFIGGLGVVVFLLLIIPSSSPMRLRLTNMEVSSLSREGYKSRTNKTVWIFAAVYLGLAVVSFLSYWAAGMSAFDAINHAFSVISTGGFSTKNLSIASLIRI